MMTTNKTVEERTNVETNITTIGRAVLIQNLIHYAAIVALAWLILSFVDGWVMTYLTATH